MQRIIKKAVGKKAEAIGRGNLRDLKVVKRDGRTEGFDFEKIKRSITSAGSDTGEFGGEEAERILESLRGEFEKKFAGRRRIKVDRIRGLVEPAIAKAGYFATAKYYILYGSKKAKEDGEWKIREPEMARHSLEVVRRRYLKTDMKGKVVEMPGEMLWRVAKHIAKAEINWGDEREVEYQAQEFFKRMADFKFVCSGKAMFEAGNEGGTGQLSACFVLEIEDSIASIFKTLGEAALIHKNNGGTGFNFSNIRPRGDKVKNVPEAASGPVDFLQAYSAALSKILQGAKRRGGNMAVLNADHPDIGEFIRVKQEDGNITNFNISVGAADRFMEAVGKNKDWELKNPRTGEVLETLKAGKLFDKIVSAAHKTGDPGMIFLDRMEDDNPTPSLGRLDATNPCGEQPLLPYESCNLSSIVLSQHLRRKKGKSEAEDPFAWEVDWKDLRKTIRQAIRFLDNMIEVNTYILPEIERIVRNGNRKIGLGVMGFAHLLYRMGIPYASREAVAMAGHLGKFIKREAEAASMELAEKRGVFPNFDISSYSGTAERYRNATMLTIAPTGTISLFADCSSGIEPIFSLVTERKAFYEDGSKNKGRKVRNMTLIDPVFEKILDEQVSGGKIKRDEKNKLIELLKNGDSLQGYKKLSKRMREVFVTTHEIDWSWHVKIQAAWQKYCDNSVSKTINFSKKAKIKDVREAYLLAWRQGCKGITIYRDGSKELQVLSGSKRKKGDAVKEIRKQEKSCPECGGEMKFAEGCATCMQCGYSYCAV